MDRILLFVGLVVYSISVIILSLLALSLFIPRLLYKVEHILKSKFIMRAISFVGELGLILAIIAKFGTVGNIVKEVLTLQTLFFVVATSMMGLFINISVEHILIDNSEFRSGINEIVFMTATIGLYFSLFMVA